MPKSSRSDLDDWREQRRLRAWALHQQGWTQTHIAQELRASQSAVSQWLKKVRQGGTEALHHRSAPGRQPMLTPKQLTQLPELIARGAKAFGFKDDRWTTKRAAAAIKHVFGVAYHASHVSRLLHKYVPEWRNQQPK